MKIINYKALTSASLFVLLTSCGGSGGSNSDPAAAVGNPPPPVPNIPLSVVDDSFFAEAGVSSNLNVLANDAGTALQISTVSSSLLGTVQIVNGELSYTANAASTGSEVLSYQVLDADQQTASANVTVYITPAGFNAGDLLSIIDLQGDGLTADDLTALGVTATPDWFGAADANSDGSLSDAELSLYSNELLNDVLLPTFTAADLDASGDLTIEEAVNLLPPELSAVVDSQTLSQFTNGVGDLTFSPEDLVALSSDLAQAQTDAASTASQIMFIDTLPFLGNNDGLLSATELQNGLSLAGGFITLPAGFDATTIPTVVDLMDLDGNGGLDQQELTTMLTLLNLFTSLTAA